MSGSSSTRRMVPGALGFGSGRGVGVGALRDVK